jgi:hypothetical protein
VFLLLITYPLPLLGAGKLRMAMASVRRYVGCCGGVQIGKSIVRNASKTTEKQLIEHADAIYQNPFIVLPKFMNESCKKRFKKLIKQVEKVEKIKDNAEKLEKISNKRTFAGAIAGTMLIHHAQKAPFLAAAPMASGNVLFALRGNAKREHLIAVQHYDDPFLRLLGIRELVIANNLYVYSWDESFICTGGVADPPTEFVNFVMKKHGLSFTPGFAHCPHITNDMIQKKKKSQHQFLLIHWKSANVSIGICKDCASSKTNFLYETTKYLIEPDIQEDFFIEVIGSIIKDERNIISSDTMFLEEYFSGRISDKQMIEKNMHQRLKHLKDSSEHRFVLNEVVYDDVKEFITALHPKSYEKKALEFLLNKNQESIVVSDVTPNTVIEMLWKKYGRIFIEEIIGDKKKAKDLYNLPDSPSQIIKTAYILQKRMEILNELPNYENLPSLASFVDKLARSFRIDGKNKVVIEIKKHHEGAKDKAISYGFLLAINKEKDFKWKYKKEEIESGEFLKPYIESLLTCSPESYHKSLQDLLTISGTPINLSDYIT